MYLLNIHFLIQLKNWIPHGGYIFLQKTEKICMDGPSPCFLGMAKPTVKYINIKNIIQDYVCVGVAPGNFICWGNSYAYYSKNYEWFGLLQWLKLSTLGVVSMWINGTSSWLQIRNWDEKKWIEYVGWKRKNPMASIFYQCRNYKPHIHVWRVLWEYSDTISVLIKQ